MTCPACQRANLTGGVRCVYCGAALPVPLEFDIQAVSDAAGPASTPSAPADPAAPSRRGGVGIVSTLTILALKGKSLLAMLKVAKLLTTFGSMFIYVAATARIYGFSLALGIAVCIFVHEMGHVVVNWSKGLKQSAPMFIPFVGAVIFIKQFPDDPTIQSESGAGGPAAGMLAAFVCLAVAHATGSHFWYTLSYIGFVINLFNLIPFPPLDGSHIASVFSPRLWDCVLIGMLLWALKAGSPFLWMVLFVGFVMRLGRSGYTRHLLARPAVRLRMAAVYFGLCIVLSTGADYCQKRAQLPGRSTTRRADPAPAVTNLQGNLATRSSTSSTPNDPDSADTDLNFHPSQSLILILNGALAGFVMLLWLATSYLLANAAGRSLDIITLAPVFWLTAGFGLLLFAVHNVPLAIAHDLPLICAYVAASVSALIFAGYQAQHASRLAARHPHFDLILRCLTWAGGAALVVAYGMESWLTALTVLACAALFVTRYRWVVSAQIASVTRQWANPSAAIRWRQSALDLNPGRDSAAAILLAQAADYLTLSRGGAALEALDGHGALAIPGRQQATSLSMRCFALILLDRYDEAIENCEQILQATTQDEFSGPARLLIAQVRLAQLARMRGWPDELKARADSVLRGIKHVSPAQTSEIQGMKAISLAEMGDIQAARELLEATAKAGQEPLTKAFTATAMAQVSLIAGETIEAERQAEQALRLLPESLEAQYWHGRSLAANGRRDEGGAKLESLARSFPLEHWGRLAGAATKPAEPVPA